jgi:hypothetical protein
MLFRVALSLLALSFADADDLKRHAGIDLSVEKGDRGVAEVKAIEGGAGTQPACWLPTSSGLPMVERLPKPATSSARSGDASVGMSLNSASREERTGSPSA